MTSLNHAHITPVDMPLAQSGRIAHCLPDGSFMVENRERGWHCRKAASCLIEPEAQDTVLIASDAGGGLWILAVLERAQAEAVAQIRMPGDLRISTPNGALDLHGGSRLALAADDFSLRARQGDCNVDALDFRSEQVSSWVGVGRWMGRCSESLWDQVTQISQHLFRHTRQTEHVRAAQLDYEAENHLQLHANHTILSSRSITKIDSAQIHVG